MNDIGMAIGRVIDELVSAAVAFATGRYRYGFQQLKTAQESLEILVSKAEQQHRKEQAAKK